jgi:hypothetical protein
MPYPHAVLLANFALTLGEIPLQSIFGYWQSGCIPLPAAFDNDNYDNLWLIVRRVSGIPRMCFSFIPELRGTGFSGTSDR